ncbi:hypothetical protein IEQ34_018721 [Dendrobium chrysotoxum]|uniref:Uncharacterized protein n=1 Tax=Dendrobium chrysotoxum TaxID=161865 RepID=A0AAV7G5C4_DENCH|nr:hypothetical protein IEQ34_018721 [Dendrobium chrysotoxum]
MQSRSPGVLNSLQNLNLVKERSKQTNAMNGTILTFDRSIRMQRTSRVQRTTKATRRAQRMMEG